MVCGSATCCSRLLRITATRSPIVIASTWSWVTYSVVTPNWRWIVEISARICTRSFASRLESGSSIRNTLGSRTIARPIATRWRWPPDSWGGLRWRWLSSPSTFAVARTLVSRSALGIRASRRGNAMLPYTVMCG